MFREGDRHEPERVEILQKCTYHVDQRSTRGSSKHNWRWLCFPMPLESGRDSDATNKRSADVRSGDLGDESLVQLVGLRIRPSTRGAHLVQIAEPNTIIQRQCQHPVPAAQAFNKKKEKWEGCGKSGLVGHMSTIRTNPSRVMWGHWCRH